MGVHKVYRFTAQLEDSKPAVWRTFEINGEKTIADLAYAIMIMFEMQASHMFEFDFQFNTKAKALAEKMKKLNMSEDPELTEIINKRYIYDLPVFHDDPMDFIKNNVVIWDASKEKLNRVDFNDANDFTFTYDFGDSWTINLHFEGMEKREVILYDMPQVIDGAGFGIIEDCGGSYGLQETYKIVHDSSNPDYPYFKQFLEEQKIDLDRFDIDDLNFRLGKLMRIYKMIYEEGRNPSAKTLAILNRDYY